MSNAEPCFLSEHVEQNTLLRNARTDVEPLSPL
jgi:hypothetical protein